MRHTGGLDLEMKDCKHDEKCTVRVEKRKEKIKPKKIVCLLHPCTRIEEKKDGADNTKLKKKRTFFWTLMNLRDTSAY